MEDAMKNAKKIFFTLFLSTLGILFMFNTSLSQQTAGQLFEKALYMEEAQGDLQKAIDLYQEILKQFPENREIAAKAQLHIGLCYEKLGLKEAEKSYQKVVDNYPEQTEAVRIAKEKLNLILKAQAVIERGDKEFKIRKVWAGPNAGGTPSPDGRYLCFVDWETGDLAIRDLLSGENKRLTNKGPWHKSQEFALCSSWSPDGKRIAYTWLNDREYWDLRIIDIETQNVRVLYSNKELRVDDLGEWTRDGKQILTRFWGKNGARHLGLVSVKDGKSRIIKSSKWPSPQHISLSPDGRFIAYDIFPINNSLNYDIYVLSVENGEEIHLISHPSFDNSLGF